MNKHAAWLFFVATCTLGCRTTWTGPQARCSSCTQAAKATFPEPTIAKSNDSTPEVDRAKKRFAHGAAAVEERATADDAAKGTFCSAVGEIVEAVVDGKNLALRGLVAMQTAKEKAVDENAARSTQRGATHVSSRASQQDVSGLVFYGMASILGTIFTCILAPLVVDCLRQRLGISRQVPQAKWAGAATWGHGAETAHAAPH